ncbi:MAG: PASTA domain-containing protein [Bacteroidales bacterium]|nr:PASTA domain-containing protein [Candidatus Sodaliphilus aphodohippi]
MGGNNINSFREKHPIIANSVLIILAFIACIYISLLAIDVFTDHGSQRKVPDVRYLTFEQAVEKLEAAGLEWDVSDSSTYNKDIKPGIILDLSPAPGAYVKPVRPIYLRINAMHARDIKMPELKDMGVRQGQAMLKSLGFSDIKVDSIQSQYEGLILNVSANGRLVKAGQIVRVDSHIRLVVGDGSIENFAPDSILSSDEIEALERENAANFEK